MFLAIKFYGGNNMKKEKNQSSPIIDLSQYMGGVDAPDQNLPHQALPAPEGIWHRWARRMRSSLKQVWVMSFAATVVVVAAFAATPIGEEAFSYPEMSIDEVAAQATAVDMDILFPAFSPETIQAVQDYLDENGYNYPGYTLHDWVVTTVAVDPSVVLVLEDYFQCQITSVEDCELVESMQADGFEFCVEIVDAE
jgi:hypothetical protein